jgi:hypothetical protein
MREQVGQTKLQEQSQQLLHGRLKHARAAALSLALVPLAVVAAVAVQTSESCESGGVCGVVFYDANNNGIQDTNESGIEGAVVTLTGQDPIPTNENGVFYFGVPPGTYDVVVQIPPGTQPAPSNSGSNDDVDSDGVPDGLGNSVATVIFSVPEGGLPYDSSTDFGFVQTPTAQPGTGTPGYWKNHPEAWPVSVTVGGITYLRDDAIALFDKVAKDKTYTMFSSLVAAKLNVYHLQNDGSCVSSTISAADEWMQKYGPVGSGVHAASYAWKVGEPLHRLMDNYNNGMLCAPHRD